MRRNSFAFCLMPLVMLAAVPAAQAAIINLQVVGVTATQALISYTAPDNGPCTIEASKSNTYAPLVHDVDPTLFAGSNLDNRIGSVGVGGVVRIIVLGKRKSEKAVDGNYYSRALQAYTEHYVRITCDTGDKATLNFMTQTIPTGQTYNDPVTSDLNIPGQYTYPSVLATGNATDRNQEIVDPQTGALIKRLTLNSDGAAGDAWGAGIGDQMVWGASRFCSESLALDSSGNKGFRCLFNGELTFINKETGQVTPLGLMDGAYNGQQDSLRAGSVCGNMDTLSPNTFYCMQPTLSLVTGSFTLNAIVQATYMGNNQPFSGNLPNCGPGGQPQPCMQWVNMTPSHDYGNGPQDLRTMMNNFDSGFSSFILYDGGCNIQGISNHRSYIACDNSNQGTLGWWFVFDPGDSNPQHAGQPNGPRIIAATNSYAHAPLRWCSDHAALPVDASQDWFNVFGDPLMSQGVTASGSNRQPGEGPYLVNLVTPLTSTLGACPPLPPGNTVPNWPTNSVCSTITVDGEARNPTPFQGDASDPTPEPAILQPALPGDYFAFLNPATLQTQEYVRILVKQINADSSQTWTIQRGYGAATNEGAGTPFYAWCITGTTAGGGTTTVAYWNVDADPHGLNAGGTILAAPWSLGHVIYDQQYLIGGGGPESNYGYDVFTGPIPQLLNSPVTPIWNDVPFDGAAGGAPGPDLDSHPSFVVTDQSGRKSFVDGRPWNGGLFFFGDSQTPAINMGGNVWKFAAGVRPLHRKQLPTNAFCGPSPMLDVSGPGSNINNQSETYCVVNQAGECRNGSQIGEVYANCPNVANAYCIYPGAGKGLNGQENLCIGDSGAYMTQLTQTVLSGSADTAGSGTRVFTHAFQINGFQNIFLNPRPVVTMDATGLASDGSAWMFFGTSATGGQPLYGNSYNQAFLVRIPPLPPTIGPTALARNDFLPTPITVPPPPSGVASDNAVVEFGYAENGAANKLYCTSRQDACVKGAPTTPPNSYNFLSDTTTIGVPCASGCTITVPMIPQRAMYYQVQYRSGRAIVASGALQVITEASSTPPPIVPLPPGNALQLNFPAYVPLSQVLNVNYNSGLPVDHVQWSFVPQGSVNGVASAQSMASALNTGQAMSFPTSAGSMTPAQHGLSLQTYDLTVQLFDAQGNIIGQGSQFITFVNSGLSSLQVYPNPWRSDKHAAFGVTFDGLTVGTTVKIFTVSGREARELQTSASKIVWDLTNNSGDKVASGIYLYLITDSQGDKVRGKLAIIR